MVKTRTNQKGKRRKNPTSLSPRNMEACHGFFKTGVSLNYKKHYGHGDMEKGGNQEVFLSSMLLEFSFPLSVGGLERIYGVGQARNHL
jgi:hypothetical protein